MSAAKRAINDIDHLNRLSLAIAMKLFQLKVAPVATYGLKNIWIHLIVKQLENIEKIKATFLKKFSECVHVHPFTPGLSADKRTLLFGGTEAAVTATSDSCLSGMFKKPAIEEKLHMGGLLFDRCHGQ
jgi:hypothetical protein